MQIAFAAVDHAAKLSRGARSPRRASRARRARRSGWIRASLDLVVGVASELDEAPGCSRRIEEGEVEPLTWALGELGRLVTAPAYAEAVRWMHQAGRRIATFFRATLLLTPTVTHRRFHSPRSSRRPTNPWPASSAPPTSRRSPPSSTRPASPRARYPLYRNAAGSRSVSSPRHNGREDMLLRISAQIERARLSSTPRPCIDVKMRDAPCPARGWSPLSARANTSTGGQPGDAARDSARDIGATGGTRLGCAQVPSGAFQRADARHRVVERELRRQAFADRRPARGVLQIAVGPTTLPCASGTRRAARSARVVRHRRWSSELDEQPVRHQPDDLRRRPHDLFVSYRTGGPGGGDFYVAKRANRSAAIRHAATRRRAQHRDVRGRARGRSNGRARPYFHSNRRAAPTTRIYRTTRAVADRSVAARSRHELASTYDDANTWVSGDDCTIYFDSTRPGWLGQYDVFSRHAPGAERALRRSSSRCPS